MSALQQIREKAAKDGQKKNEETISRWELCFGLIESESDYLLDWLISIVIDFWILNRDVLNCLITRPPSEVAVCILNIVP